MNKFMKKIMSKKDGFTLVELIVVIAILAILAGVAVPVYSSYIKKANEAGDTVILGAANTALAAAATENQIAFEDLNDYLTFDDDDDASTAGSVITVTVVEAKKDDATAKELLKDFISYNNVATITFDYYENVVFTDSGLEGVDPA